jgi:ribosomal 30S subunit maturation factor RimM
MEIIQVEIKNKNAMAILKGMEKAQIIRLLKRKKSSNHDIVALKGIFSREKAMELAGQVNKSREEWNERTI